MDDQTTVISICQSKKDFLGSVCSTVASDTSGPARGSNLIDYIEKILLVVLVKMVYYIYLFLDAWGGLSRLK